MIYTYMKTILAAIFLATVTSISNAEPHPRQVRFMCGSLEELEMTVEKYGEKMVIATQSPDERTVNMLYVNFETQTSSWIIHDLATNDYCMIGVGKAIHIPDDSPIKQGIGIGTRTIYK